MLHYSLKLEIYSYSHDFDNLILFISHHNLVEIVLTLNICYNIIITYIHIAMIKEQPNFYKTAEAPNNSSFENPTPKQLESLLQLIKSQDQVVEIKKNLPGDVLLTEKIYYKDFPPTIAEFYADNTGRPRRDLILSQNIILKNQNEQEKSVYELLPPNRRVYFANAQYNNFQDAEDLFVIWPLEHFDPETNEIIKKGDIVIYSDLERPGAILSLLHEVGHIWVNREVKKEISVLRIAVNALWTQAKNEGRKIANDSEVLYSPPLGEVDKEEKYPVSKQLLVHLEKLEARNERDAWAFALKKFRELRKLGFNIEPMFDSNDKIRQFIYGSSALGSYEQELDNLLENELNLFIK